MSVGGVSSFEAFLFHPGVVACGDWRGEAPPESARRHRLQINKLCSRGEQRGGVGLRQVRRYVAWLRECTASELARFEEQLRLAASSSFSVLGPMQQSTMPCARSTYSVPWCARAVNHALGLVSPARQESERYAHGMSCKNRTGAGSVYTAVQAVGGVLGERGIHASVGDEWECRA